MGELGGLHPSQNPFGLDLSQPQPPLTGQSYTETMHAITIGKDGRQYHVVLVPGQGQPYQPGQLFYGGYQCFDRVEPRQGDPGSAYLPPLAGGGSVPGHRLARCPLADSVKRIRDRDGNDDNIAVKCFDQGGSGQGVVACRGEIQGGFQVWVWKELE